MLLRSYHLRTNWLRACGLQRRQPMEGAEQGSGQVLQVVRNSNPNRCPRPLASQRNVCAVRDLANGHPQTSIA